MAPDAVVTDVGCKIWADNVCNECSFGFVFSADGSTCLPVSDQCKTHDADGNCLTCYSGYNLVEGACLRAENPAAVGGCKVWDAEGICITCAPRWVFNGVGDCVPVSDDCREHETNGFCSACYRGYGLVEDKDEAGSVINVRCEVAPKANTDLGCKVWNWEEMICEECSFNFFSNNGVCTQVSPNCQTHDANNGLCLSCYQGY